MLVSKLAHKSLTKTNTYRYNHVVCVYEFQSMSVIMNYELLLYELFVRDFFFFGIIPSAFKFVNPL